MKKGKEFLWIKREDNDGIVEIKLNRVEQHNALSKALIQELQAVLDKEASLAVALKSRAVIFTSASEKAFCAGADLKERLLMSEKEVRQTLNALNTLMNSVESLACPTFAILSGVAFGGGLELALSCDFRMASHKAEVGLTETKLAIIPGAGGTQRLGALIGESRAKEMIFRGRKLRAEEAYDYGILNYLGEDPRSEAMLWAKDILAAGPLAIVQAKKAIRGNRAHWRQAGLKLERKCYEVVLKSKDRLEALKAFSEKRSPKFLGK